MIIEITVATNVQQFREVFPEKEFLSMPDFNRLLLEGVFRIIESDEIVLAAQNVRFFRVVAEKITDKEKDLT